MSKKENRKEKKTKLILEKAIVVIAEKGYHAATVSDIAKEAGVAAGSIYNHFDNTPNYQCDWALDTNGSP